MLISWVIQIFIRMALHIGTLHSSWRVSPECISTLKSMPLEPQNATRERYLALEKSSPISLAVLGLAVAASAAIRFPAFLFALGSMVAGTLVFLAWQASLRQRPSWSFSFALASLLTALMAMAGSISEPLPLLIVQGLGLVGFVFFACVLMAQRQSKV